MDYGVFYIIVSWNSRGYQPTVASVLSPSIKSAYTLDSFAVVRELEVCTRWRRIKRLRSGTETSASSVSALGGLKDHMPGKMQDDLS